MRKKFVLFTLFSITSILCDQASASQSNSQTRGVVTALNAPVYSLPDTESATLLYRRKGQYIYIHPQHFHRDPLNHKSDEESQFYKTMTDIGNDGYILREHVFLQTKDGRELAPIRLQKDPTDYRLPEPIDENYPL